MSQIGGEGRGSITFGQSPKIYTFFILKASLIDMSGLNNFSGCVNHHSLLDFQNDYENPGVGLQKSKIQD